VRERDKPNYSRCEESLGNVASQAIGSVVLANPWHIIEEQGLRRDLEEACDDCADKLGEEYRPRRKLHVMSQLHILHKYHALGQDLKRDSLRYLIH
jgi:hypothetical protein